MNGKGARSFDTVFVLLIFCLFTVCSLFLVLIGAKVYRGIVGQMDANNETRASLSYVANKVHAAGSGNAAVRTIGGQRALVISSDYGGENYRTYIYEYKGSLMELFTKAEHPFTPGDGDIITEIPAFRMSQSGGKLELSATGRDRRTLTLSLFLS